ncbi:MAG: glycosyl transferase family 28 [Bacteroidetes bacterium]|nr:glycosyl transferase family 28 [Bacteroidota bacterium]
MPADKNNKINRVLVAPLDWGLGHATRCIPLIRQLLDDGNQVFLAGSGASGHLLRLTFPELDYKEIPSHNIYYAGSGKGQTCTLLQQLPALFRQMKKEKQWLQSYLNTQPIDKLISDNRYGLHHPRIQNILITHQLGLRSGVGVFFDRMLQKILCRLLKNFNEVWVPDHEKEPTLSGELGHPSYTPPIPIRYLGPLSRFHSTDRKSIPEKITIVLSGPEPQRSIMEKKCLNELFTWKGPVSLIRGLPFGGKPIEVPEHWRVFDQLNIQSLQQEIEEASHLIARCGYSTVMDLEVLRKKAILIPTPGQPEQEYLATWLNEKNLQRCVDQQKDLAQVIASTQSPGNFADR